jgi:glycerol kinase
VTAAWRVDAQFEPQATAEEADAKHAQWTRAVQRSLGWAKVDSDS